MTHHVREDVANPSVPVVPGSHARLELNKKTLGKAKQGLKGKIVDHDKILWKIKGNTI